MHKADLFAGYEQTDSENTVNQNGIIINNRTIKSDLSSSYEQFPSDDEHCHLKDLQKGIDKSARKKLLVASGLCLVFMIAETTGGALAHSLAIMTDAAHLLTDFASFLISLFAIFLASRPATKSMSFGWHRAEVVGALISVLMIWLVTGILVYMAILRIINDDFEINGKIMLITSTIGVGVNFLMAATLHQHGHGGHEHSHCGSKKFEKYSNNSHKPVDRRSKVCEDETEKIFKHNRDFKSEFNETSINSAKQALLNRQRDVESSSNCDLSFEDQEHIVKEKENMNVRAAFIHVIGDLLQSSGVFIGSMIIYFKPEYKIADPICTFIFSIIVLITTISILRDAMNILMEGTPKSLSYVDVKMELNEIPGVIEVHNLRLWSLTVSKTAVSVHLALENIQNSKEVLTQANRLLHRRFLVNEVTIQIEQYINSMANCIQCQELNN